MSELETSVADPSVHHATMCVALACGYNQLAKDAETLGAKVYYRLMREEALRQAREEGVEVSVERPQIVLTLREAPEVRFTEADIALMADFLAKRAPKPGVTPSSEYIAQELDKASCHVLPENPTPGETDEHAFHLGLAGGLATALRISHERDHLRVELDELKATNRLVSHEWTLASFDRDRLRVELDALKATEEPEDLRNKIPFDERPEWLWCILTGFYIQAKHPKTGVLGPRRAPVTLCGRTLDFPTYSEDGEFIHAPAVFRDVTAAWMASHRGDRFVPCPACAKVAAEDLLRQSDAWDGETETDDEDEEKEEGHGCKEE